MSRVISSALSPLITLLGARRGTLLPLPLKLERLYGPLRMPQSPGRAHVFSNFVTTLDGVVSLAAKGHDVAVTPMPSAARSSASTSPSIW